MNYFLKYRVAIWAIVILSVIILSSIGTLFFFKLHHRPDRFKDEDSRRHDQIGQFFKNELKLSPDQEKAFKGFRRQFFQNSRAIFDSLEKKRILMIEELGKEKPDSITLFRISDEMGVLHSKLKRATVRNLLSLRSVCTPEQIKKLNTINRELIGAEGPMRRMVPRKGQGPSPQRDGKRRPNSW
jgi:hypothetical protein